MNNSEADQLLCRWGAWSRHNISIGYSPENIIYKMMRDSFGAGHQSVRAEIAMPQKIQEVDAIIAGFRKGIIKAVKLQYIANLPVFDAANRCRCSEPEFNRRINYAVEVVAGHFDG